MEDELRSLKICICIPSYDINPALFGFDLAAMMTYSTATLVNSGIASLAIKMRVGTYAHRAREQLVEEVLEEGFDYILWLDADMRFPKDALIQLLAHNEDIVGTNYSTRGSPPRFVAIKTLVTEVEEGELGRQLRTDANSTGLEEVAALGFGCVLIKTAVFADLKDQRPWFFYKFVKGHHTGEDVWFCQLARENGYKVLVDHDLSKQIAHIGQYEYDVLQVARLKEDYDQRIGGDEPELFMPKPELEIVE